MERSFTSCELVRRGLGGLRPLRPHPGRRRWGALVALVALFHIPAGTRSQDASREEELEEIRLEIQALQSELEEIGQRTHDLVGEMEQIRLQIELQERRIAEARAAYALAQEDVASMEGKVGALESRLDDLRLELRNHLVVLYSLGRHGYARLFLSIEPGSDVLAAVRQLRYLIRRDTRALERYRNTRDELDEERESLALTREEAGRWLESEEDERRKLGRIERRQETLLAEVDRQRLSLVHRTQELEDKERRLSYFLDLLYGRTEVTLEGTPVQDFRGVLDWPVEGPVVVEFGPRLDPRYGTQVPHNGIEIEVEKAPQVRVVYPGKVLFAAPFEGYGQTVIVHHPGRVFTLYAGLTRLRVTQGGMVSLGDVLGSASSRLYFEVRNQNEPENPLLWLR